jgi:hypothetical protein
MSRLSAITFIASALLFFVSVGLAWHAANDLAEAQRSRAMVDAILRAEQERIREAAQMMEEAHKANEAQSK